MIKKNNQLRIPKTNNIFAILRFYVKIYQNNLLVKRKDPEIKRVVGIEKYEQLSEQEKIIENFKFNDDFQKMQALLPGGFPGIPKGVYRFKNQEDADKQVNYYIMKTAMKR